MTSCYAEQYGYDFIFDDLCDQNISEVVNMPIICINRQILNLEYDTELQCTNFSKHFITAKIPHADDFYTLSYHSARVKCETVNPDPYTVEYSGEMKKSGDHIKTWYWRYFVLKHSVVSYYKSKEDTKQIKSFKLIDLKITRVSEKRFDVQTSSSPRLWRF